MAAGLPFAEASFDAAMANVALRMFTDVVTRAVFADVRRVLRPRGLFLFHVNAHDDRPLREHARPVLRELEPDYVLEEARSDGPFLLAGISGRSPQRLARGHARAPGDHARTGDRAP
jgi:SAM-dependent methyltransferase